MESETNSLDSEDGVELSNGDQPEHVFMESKYEPSFLEAETMYVLLAKNVPISRAKRFQWFLDNLNKLVRVPMEASMDNDIGLDMKIISILPADRRVNQYLVTRHTCVKFLSHSYRFVYCIDMSPSNSTVDTANGGMLFEQIMRCFKASLQALCTEFMVPGHTFVFQPNIYMTVIVNTPFFMSPAQQVLVKGVKVTVQNIEEVIQLVESQFGFLERRIAKVCGLAYESIEQQIKERERLIETAYYVSETIPNLPRIPMVLADANFVNMLRYSMLGISLLPENSVSHILVITDGIVAMPDSNLMESLLLQLHYESIAVSFLKIGPAFVPQSSAGYVPYSDLLQYISNSTLGTYMGNVVHVKSEPNFPMNIYHQSFLVWSFHSKKKSFSSSALGSENLWMIPNSFHRSRTPILLSKKHTEENVSASVSLLFL